MLVLRGPARLACDAVLDLPDPLDDIRSDIGSPEQVGVSKHSAGDLGIDAFEVSPERVTLMVAGKKRSYVPAYRLRRGSATVMVDILHRAQEKHPLRPVVTATITAGYARIGVHYRALPERRVFAQPRYGNARFVLGHRGLDTRAETELAVVRVLGRKGPHDVASVVSALPDLPDARETLLALAARRRVKLGLWAPTIGGMRAELISWGGLS